jgi:hypothetical protein
MLQGTIALPSGRRENLAVPKSSNVGDLRTLAQKRFQQGFLRPGLDYHGFLIEFPHLLNQQKLHFKGS